MTPVLLSSFIKSKVVAAVATFVPVFAITSLHYISLELENPFGTDDNDLPMCHFQAEMDSCLLMLLHPNADLVSGISANMETDFDKLVKVVHGEAPGDPGGALIGAAGGLRRRRSS